MKAVITIIITSIAFSTVAISKAQRTFKSVATYYCTANDSYIIDDLDGNIYDANFNVANGTKCNVVYDNNNTLTRLDDNVIKCTPLK